MSDKYIIAARIPHYAEWFRRYSNVPVTDVQVMPDLRRWQVNKEHTLVGGWPVHMMRAAGTYLTIEYDPGNMPRRPPESVDEMVAHGARLVPIHLFSDEELSRLLTLARQDPPTDLKQLHRLSKIARHGEASDA